MTDSPVLTPPSPAAMRADLERLVILDLLGLTGGSEEEIAKIGVRDLLNHGFHQTKQGLRYTISGAARRMVLDRLLALNHQCYAEEVATGLYDKGAKKAAGKGGKGKKASEGQEGMF